jgi:hypothetical protein
MLRHQSASLSRTHGGHAERVWEENLPEFDPEANGAKYKGINKKTMELAEAAVWDNIQDLAVRFPRADRIVLGVREGADVLLIENDFISRIDPTGSKRKTEV